MKAQTIQHTCTTNITQRDYRSNSVCTHIIHWQGTIWTDVLEISFWKNCRKTLRREIGLKIGAGSNLRGRTVIYPQPCTGRQRGHKVCKTFWNFKRNHRISKSESVWIFFSKPKSDIGLAFLSPWAIIIQGVFFTKKLKYGKPRLGSWRGWRRSALIHLT